MDGMLITLMGISACLYGSENLGDWDSLLERGRQTNRYSAPTVCVQHDTLLRCRTCSFFVTKDWATGGCSMLGGACTADDYCSWGKWISNTTN